MVNNDEPTDVLLGPRGSRDNEHQDIVTEDDTRTAGRGLIRKIYISHLLSTWNSRLFEFGAYLFLAEIYPQTLLPASIYALSRAACAALLSPVLGRWVDSGNRLVVVRWSIVGQRAAVAVSCVLLFAFVRLSFSNNSRWLSGLTLTTLSLLAVVEKLSSVVNTIAIERDWVVVIAQDDEATLRSLNSSMRRIDLICKLIGPLAISFVDTASTELAIIATGLMSAASFPIEYYAIARVYGSVPALRAAKTPKPSHGETHTTSHRSCWNTLRSASMPTLVYAQHPAFLPSFALALLYLTVLSFNGQMITYLLSFGVSSGIIGLLRGISACFELSATWLGPQAMKKIGPIRAGIWFINWQITCITIATAFFWWDASASVVVAGTVCAVMASRVGLWGFDLSTQLIIQEEVEPELRGAFASQEYVFQNIFEMLAFASTIIIPRPDHFKIPATVSAVAVAIAGILYATFVRSRRGHLVHLSKCVERQQKKRHLHRQELLLADDTEDYELLPGEQGGGRCEGRRPSVSDDYVSGTDI